MNADKKFNFSISSIFPFNYPISIDQFAQIDWNAPFVISMSVDIIVKHIKTNYNHNVCIRKMQYVIICYTAIKFKFLTQLLIKLV